MGDFRFDANIECQINTFISSNIIATPKLEIVDQFQAVLTKSLPGVTIEKRTKDMGLGVMQYQFIAKSIQCTEFRDNLPMLNIVTNLN